LVPWRGRDDGAALLDHADEAGAELLVVGAYGHSRAREFVLGGATRTILANPRLPVLLSH
jgi:nucleotide-binding universal stress UspA family protein